MNQPSFPSSQYPEAASLLQDKAALKKILTSPQTKALIQLLSAQSGSLHNAANQAKAGNTDALKSMLDRLGATPEGAKVLGDLEQTITGR